MGIGLKRPSPNIMLLHKHKHSLGIVVASPPELVTAACLSLTHLEVYCIAIYKTPTSNYLISNAVGRRGVGMVSVQSFLGEGFKLWSVENPIKITSFLSRLGFYPISRGQVS